MHRMTVETQFNVDVLQASHSAIETKRSAIAPAVDQRSSLGRFARKLLREPLFHFLLAGGLILVASNLWDHSKASSLNQHHIVVPAAEIHQLQEIWTRQWGHPPNTEEMAHLIDDYVREEIFYREALASGLDNGDVIIRRRLVEKMEFLSQEIASSAEPSESELEQFFQNGREKYASPAQAAFSHIYFSSSKRGAAAETDAQGVLAGLRSGQLSLPHALSQGDPFISQSEYPLQSRDQVKEIFGDEFAFRLLSLEPGEWEGPFKSSYGFHLVRVLQRTPSRVPQLAEVRQEVLIDLKNQRLQSASDSYYGKLRELYRIDVDKVALAEVGKGRQP
jgi:peptidyl-prolyl cis-trans isomerase C